MERYKVLELGPVFSSHRRSISLRATTEGPIRMLHRMSRGYQVPPGASDCSGTAAYVVKVAQVIAQIKFAFISYSVGRVGRLLTPNSTHQGYRSKTRSAPGSHLFGGLEAQGTVSFRVVKLGASGVLA